MKPLFVLLLVFSLSAVITWYFSHEVEWARSGRIAMFAMLCFTSLGHFMYTKGMSLMIPDAIPFKIALVYITGFMELALGVALLWPPTRTFAGWALLVFFLLMLPANIFAAIRQLDYQTGTFNGHGIAYLWFRVPLQLFFMGWVYVCAIRFY